MRSSISIAMFGAIPNYIWIFSSTRPICRRTSPSTGSDCFGAVWSVWSLFRSIRSRHSSSIMEKWNVFSPDSVSRRFVSVRVELVVGLLNTRSLYLGFAPRKISLTCRGNLRSSASAVVHSRSFLMSFIFVPIVEKRNDSRECISAGVGSHSTGETSSMTWKMEGAGVPCCIIGSWGVILRVLVLGLSFSSFFSAGAVVLFLSVCGTRRFRSENNDSSRPRLRK